MYAIKRTISLAPMSKKLRRLFGITGTVLGTPIRKFTTTFLGDTVPPDMIMNSTWHTLEQDAEYYRILRCTIRNSYLPHRKQQPIIMVPTGLNDTVIKSWKHPDLEMQLAVKHEIVDVSLSWLLDYHDPTQALQYIAERYPHNPTAQQLFKKDGESNV